MHQQEGNMPREYLMPPNTKQELLEDIECLIYDLQHIEDRILDDHPLTDFSEKDFIIDFKCLASAVAMYKYIKENECKADLQ